MPKLRNWTLGWLKATNIAREATWTATKRNIDLMRYTTSRALNPLADEPEEVVSSDRRFHHEGWQSNIVFNWLKQNYLIQSEWLADLADGWLPVDENVHQQVKFWTQQWIDTVSPSNFALTNPEVWEESWRTGGTSLLRGAQNWWGDVRHGRVSMVPSNSFEIGKNLATTPGKVIYRNALIELIQYAPSTPHVYEVPVLVIPPWINKYYIMDLRPENSMFKYLIDQGFTLYTISWKNPDASILDLTWADYMHMGPLAAADVVRAITGADEIHFVGYCLGGILLQTTLAYLAAKGIYMARTATFFTTHQDFRDAGDVEVFLNTPGVALVEAIMQLNGGYLDGRHMAATFNMLRANELLWHYVINNYLLGKDPPAFDLLYWNSDGTRIPGKVHAFLLREFFLKNRLMQPGAITIDGVALDTRTITVPTYCVAGSTDHIVPWQGAARMRQLHGGPVRFVLAESGHIAGIINHPAAKKRAYWVHDADEAQEYDPEVWFDTARKTDGSWWLDWIPWLARHAGQTIAPPALGNDLYPPLVDAPGTYVLET